MISKGFIKTSLAELDVHRVVRKFVIEQGLGNHAALQYNLKKRVLRVQK